MTKFNIFPSSPTALSNKATDGTNKLRVVGAEKYPWRSLPVGKSFSIPLDGNVKFETINNSCYKWSKKLNCIFRAFKHETCIEVARLR